MRRTCIDFQLVHAASGLIALELKSFTTFRHRPKQWRTFLSRIKTPVDGKDGCLELVK